MANFFTYLWVGLFYIGLLYSYYMVNTSGDTEMIVYGNLFLTIIAVLSTIGIILTWNGSFGFFG